MPERLRTLGHGRPWHDDQFASSSVPPSRGHVEVAARAPLVRGHVPLCARIRASARCRRPGSCRRQRVRRWISLLSRSIMLFVRILLRDEPIKPGPGHVPVDPHGVLGHGSVSWFPIAVLSFWRMKKPYAGRGAMPFTSSLKTQSAQEFGRYPQSA